MPTAATAIPPMAPVAPALGAAVTTTTVLLGAPVVGRVKLVAGRVVALVVELRAELLPGVLNVSAEVRLDDGIVRVGTEVRVELVAVAVGG